ncbi:MAG: MFS transporter [Planctomycetes bacterium]|nr:MFS transporter [Planctomycetota bacterium]
MAEPLAPADPLAEAAARRRRALILVLLFAATLINYIDRQVFAILAAPLSAEFDWGPAEYSQLVLCFQVAYAIGQFGSGLLLDRMGLRLGFALFVLAWSLAAAGHALAASFAGFALCRFLLGLTEAANWPAAAKATGEWFAPQARAFATGVWNTGSATGAVIAAPLVTWIALKFADPPVEGGEPKPAWQLAFAATASLGALWIVAWIAIYRRPERPAGAIDAADAARADAPPASRAALFRRPEVIGLFLARLATDPVWWFFLIWLPKYLIEKKGLTLAELGAIAWIPWLFADVGSLAGGLFTSQLIRRGWPVLRARRLGIAIAGVLMPFAIVAARGESVVGVIACASIAGFAHQWFASSVLTLPADLFQGPLVATCSGISGVGATLGGILANLGTAWWLEQAPDRYQPLFVVAGLGHPLAVVLLFWFLRRRFAGAAAGGRE